MFKIPCTFTNIGKIIQNEIILEMRYLFLTNILNSLGYMKKKNINIFDLGNFFFHYHIKVFCVKFSSPFSYPKMDAKLKKFYDFSHLTRLFIIFFKFLYNLLCHYNKILFTKKIINY